MNPLRPRSISVMLAAGLIMAAFAFAVDDKAPSADPVAALMSRMTLEEKIGQLVLEPGGYTFNPGGDSDAVTAKDLVKSGRVGALIGVRGAEACNDFQRAAVEETRLGIPLLFGNDIIHGYRTIFPIPLAEACSWNLALIERAARVAATEGRAAGTNWNYAPMVDVCRDPRWGRIAEGAGEDPTLGAAVAAARVRGFQAGDPSRPDALLACMKHFAAYGAPEGGRDYNIVEVSPMTLREVHLPAFRAAVEAGVGSAMSAFNEINGVPATADRKLMTEILREEWGFDGFVVSDWTSIMELTRHGVAADKRAAGLTALRAGVDMDMSAHIYADYLADAVAKGELREEYIDRAVERVLRAKQRLGLFKGPYANPDLEAKVILCDKHRQAAREMSQQSIVLLKNEGGVLPLPAEVKSIAVIGPLADDADNMLGTWSADGRKEDVVTPLAGLRERYPDAAIEHIKGCEIQDDGPIVFADAVAAVQRADVAIVCVGEARSMSGEASCRTDLNLPGRQRDLVRAVKATGKPMVVVVFAGRPLTINWTAENAEAIVWAWQLGTGTGDALADVLSGDFNPCGRLCVTFPRAVGQIPIYHAYKQTGRPPAEGVYHRMRYLDIPSSPLYPFGYGLSYTTFEYADLRIEPPTIPPDGEATATVTVKNTGSRAGVTVAQLYVRDMVASRTRALRELQGFERVELDAGESKTLTFKVGLDELGFYDVDLDYVVEPGEFEVWVGPDAVSGPSVKLTVAESGGR